MGDVHNAALHSVREGQREGKKKKEMRKIWTAPIDPKMLSTFRAVLLVTMTMTMQCHMTTKTFQVAGSGKSRSIKSRSSPSPRNARSAMHPMINAK